MDVFDYAFDIDEALENDSNGEALRAIKDGLQEAQTIVRKEIDKGLAPVDFQPAEELRKSFDVASDAVQKLWEGANKQ
jgi:hypothetical protein